MLYISIFCIFCRFFCLLTIKIFFPQKKLLYNGAKSFSMCFKNNAIKIKQPSFYLAHLKIPIVENCKYLGITISTKTLILT